MTTMELLSDLQRRVNDDEVLTVTELRDATLQTMRFLVFNVTSGDANNLGPVSGGITQVTELYFDRIDRGEEGPREWARCLAIIGQIAVAFYESMGPSAEALKMLGRSQHAKNIAQILLSKGSLQAKELREQAAIRHQPTLARIIHTLANARIVSVESGPGNTAWYRLTPDGSRLLRNALLSPSIVAVPEPQQTLARAPTARAGDIEQIADVMKELRDMMKKLETRKEEKRTKGPEKRPTPQKARQSHAMAR